jgi:sec-independent protein translocase protein TatA
MVGVPGHVLLFLDNLGGGELLVILFFILVFFGSKKIPGLAKGLGRGLREMRNAMNDVRIDIEQAARADEPAKKQEPRGQASDGKPGAPEEQAP